MSEHILRLTMKKPSSLVRFLAVFALMQCVSCQSLQEAFRMASKGITQEIADAKNPIASSISYVGSSQCSNVKKLIGVDYEQVNDIAEPNLNELTLNFICPEFRINFTLEAAPRLLPVTKGYDPRVKLVLFMHGFTDNPENDNFKAVNEAFQSIGHTNILALDASPLIRWLYLRSSTYVRFIGEKLGETLAAMVQNGLDPKDIHLVGHSLGAHISAFAGKRFKELTGYLVMRMTGLDPAGPCFSHVEDKLRLKATDAHFVDVIHSDAGVYGINEAVGMADYYPNGGSQQPSCLFESCSHSRAVRYFAESVTRRDAFPARRCADYEAFKNNNCTDEISLMGLGAEPGTRGKFYLDTAEEEPFGLGKQGLSPVKRGGIIKSIKGFFG